MHTRRISIAAGWVVSTLWVLGGCGGNIGGEADDADATGGDAGSPDLDGLAELRVEPADVALVVDGSEPASQDYTAIGEFDDGRTADLTAAASFSLSDGGLGSFEGPTLSTTPHRGGRARVSASAGGVEGSADLTVRIERAAEDPEADLPDNPEDAFDGAEEDEGMRPEVVYPAPGVMVPPNLRDLEIHFVPPDGGDLFELDFASETTDIQVYTTCALEIGGGCVYSPSEEVWGWLADSNRDGRVELTVTAADEAGEAKGASEGREVAFSSDDIRGAIYYWTTLDDGGDDTAIVRFDVGRSEGEPETLITEDQADDNCVGCHALSRDGTKMFTAADGGTDGRTLLTDVATGDELADFDSTPNNAFASWAPGGNEFVGVFANDNYEGDGFIGYDLNVFEGRTGDDFDTGELLYSIDVGGTQGDPSHHPDWSPDGDRITFGRVLGATGSDGSLAFGEQVQLGVVEREGDGEGEGEGAWSAPFFVTSPEEGENTYFPTFSPEGDLIAYNRSTCPDGENGGRCDAHADENADIYVIAPEEGAEPVPLEEANTPRGGGGDEIMNSFPKWTPFTFERTGEFGDRLFWMSFASNRDYGLRDAGGEHDTILWMTAVDPDAALSGEDPSWPAFAIPFQELDTDNHTAQWAEGGVIIE